LFIFAPHFLISPVAFEATNWLSATRETLAIRPAILTTSESIFLVCALHNNFYHEAHQMDMVAVLMMFDKLCGKAYVCNLIAPSSYPFASKALLVGTSMHGRT